MLSRIEPPTTYPVSVDEVKSNLRLSPEDLTHDGLLQSLIAQATEQLEKDTGRVFAQAKFIRYVSDFTSPVQMQLKPIQSIDGVNYVDAEGTTQTLPTENYYLAPDGKVYFTGDLPEVGDVVGGIEITFIAGYADDPNVMPELPKRAIHLQVGKWFYDPAMESATAYAHDEAYERIVRRLMRESYP